MDLYFWSLLRNHSFHTLLSQLPYLVFSRPWDDHLYGLVLGHSLPCSRPGKKKPVKTNKSTAMIFLPCNPRFALRFYIWSFCCSGWRRDPLRSNKASALLHRSHQHSLHLWRTCCDCVSFFFFFNNIDFTLPFLSLSFSCFYTASLCSFCRPSWGSRPPDKIMQTNFVCSETNTTIPAPHLPPFPLLSPFLQGNWTVKWSYVQLFANCFSLLQLDSDLNLV